jgi:hypothetical protein
VAASLPDARPITGGRYTTTVAGGHPRRRRQPAVQSLPSDFRDAFTGGRRRSIVTITKGSNTGRLIVMNRRRLLVRAATGVAALVVSVGVAQPAHAHVIRTYEGSDYASIDTDNWFGGYWVEVCDMEQDGNGVYAIFLSPSGWNTVNDTNGSAGGCGNERVDLGTDSFKVCEDDWGPDTCSSWVDF